MLHFVLAAIYLIAAVGVGYLGRRTMLGALGTFLVSLVITPLLAFILVLAFARPVGRSTQTRQ